MQTSVNNNPQTFHMSIVDPLLFIVLLPLLAIYFSAKILSNDPDIAGILSVAFLAGISIFAFVSGMRTVRKLEFTGNDLVFSFYGWKQRVDTTAIKAYALTMGNSWGRVRPIVSIRLKSGKILKLKEIKGGPDPLLAALEQWTGFQAEYDLRYAPTIPAAEEKTDTARPPEPLSELTEQVVQKLFPPEEQYEARQLLIYQCGNNIDGHQTKDKYALESLRFSVLKVSKGDIKRLQRAVEIAQKDFRDIYIEAGFYGEKSPAKKEKWLKTVLGKEI